MGRFRRGLHRPTMPRHYNYFLPFGYGLNSYVIRPRLIVRAGLSAIREPMFAFAFEGALFAFAVAKPSFAPLFALPPTFRPQS